MRGLPHGGTAGGGCRSPVRVSRSSCAHCSDVRRLEPGNPRFLCAYRIRRARPFGLRLYRSCLSMPQLSARNARPFPVTFERRFVSAADVAILLDLGVVRLGARTPITACAGWVARRVLSD